MTTTEQRHSLQMALPSILVSRMKEASLDLTKESFTDLVYILQEVHKIPLGYRFTLYVYGPQCTQLAAELDMSKLRGLVNVEYNPEAKSTRVTPGPKRKRIEENNRILADYERQIHDTVRTFGHLSPGELNIRSSIIYVWEQSSEVHPEDLQKTDRVTKMMWALKPHQEEARVQKAIHELKELKIIG